MGYGLALWVGFYTPLISLYGMGYSPSHKGKLGEYRTQPIEPTHNPYWRSIYDPVGYFYVGGQAGQSGQLYFLAVQYGCLVVGGQAGQSGH